MGREIVIGRSADSPVAVPPDRVAVSQHHARVTLGDDGSLWVEDCGSTNGTYLRDATGEFRRVYRKQVAPTDVIRLGDGGGSFTFMAYRAGNPRADYSFEFRQLRRQLVELQQDEERKEKTMARNSWVARLSGLGVLLVCALAAPVLGVNVDPNVRYVLIAAAPVAVGLLFRGDTRAMKTLRKRRERLLVCPKCERPLSDVEIEQRKCFKCGAQ